MLQIAVYMIIVEFLFSLHADVQQYFWIFLSIVL